MESRPHDARAQEVADLRAALELAIGIGERLQARIDAARFLLQATDIQPMRGRLLEVLDGKL